MHIHHRENPPWMETQVDFVADLLWEPHMHTRIHLPVSRGGFWCAGGCGFLVDCWWILVGFDYFYMDFGGFRWILMVFFRIFVNFD